MTDSASELDLESDASSIDGHTGRCEQLQRQVELLLHQNRLLKTEADQLNLRVKNLAEKNEQLRRNSVSILAQAEREEEYISNTLQRQISELKKDKESLVVRFEEEEERLINDLNRKLTQLQKDKDKLERTLAKEQEAQVNKLKHRIERLEGESKQKQEVLDRLRHDKIELENTLEQEQEALVNKLWKKMKKLEDEKRILQNKLESVSAPLSESSSVQHLPAMGISGTSHARHSASIVMDLHQTGQYHSEGSSLRGSLRIPITDVPTRDGFDSFESSRCQSDNAGLFSGHSGARSSLTSSLSPRPPQSPMELDDIRLDSSRSRSSSHRDSSLSGNPTAAELRSESTSTGAAYVAKLREEVVSLRRIVAANQMEQVLGSNQERSTSDDNARLRLLLEAEVDRSRVLTRTLSDSESSLELDDERLFNEARRFGCYSSLGQGHNSGRICRECGHPLPVRAPYLTPPSPSPSSGSFVKPSPRVRPPHSLRQSNAPTSISCSGLTASMTRPSRHSPNILEGEDDAEEDDEYSKTPPASITD